jgi:hypothetical protein
VNATYDELVLGARSGSLALAFGHAPYRTEAGRYAHREWVEMQFEWPAEKDKLAVEIARLHGEAVDVYVCPAVRFTKDRRKGSALPPMVCWVDLDGEPADPDLWRTLAPLTVASGQPGHRHAYLPLTRPVDLGTHARLNKALAQRLGGDHKWSDESLLRFPGTWNHKTDPPSPVIVESADGAVWDPDKLAQVLGVILTPGAGPAVTTGPPGAAEPLDLTQLPQRVRDAVALDSGDRSADTMRVVGACHSAGLTLAQTRYVVSDRADLRQRLTERNDDDVLTCWLKATDSRNARRTADEWVDSIAVTSPGEESGEVDENVAERLFGQLVEQEAGKLRVRAAARALVDAEQRATEPVAAFDAGTLAEVLARPAEPPHRVEGLIPSEASTLIVAQRKTGKTTLELCLARSLIIGGDFLGRFDVRPIAGRVGFLNFEVSAGQLARWARDLGIPDDRLYLVNLRGRRNPLANPEDRAMLAAALRAQQVETLIVDPFGRAYGGQSQNDSGEVGAWLTDLDYFARGEVGASDLVLSAHAGWNGERTRGSSALEDWADSIITLIRDADDDSIRFLRAMGRDVEIDEDRLSFDPTTRLLSMTGAGSRKAVAKVRHLEDLVPAVVQVVKGSPGITGYKLAPALREAGHSCQRGDEIKAAALAVERGLLRIESGKRNSKQYFTAAETPTYPDLPRPTPTGEVLTYPDLPYRSGVGQRGMSEPHLPRTCPSCESLAGKGITSGCADHCSGPVAS